MDYLNKNIAKAQQVELWSITFGGKNDIYKVKNIKQVKLSDITKGVLMELNSQGICIQII